MGTIGIIIYSQISILQRVAAYHNTIDFCGLINVTFN